ncbi:MAG: RluA family pseudouridine synthase [Polyangiales bacterium]
MDTSAPLRVLYRDAKFIACDKPSAILTTRGGEGDADSLTERVRRELCPDAEVLHPLSRLDFDVSGVVLFATSYEATQHAAKVRAAGQYQREYHALVHPPLVEKSAEWTWEIGVDPRKPERRIAGGGRERERAHTLARERERRGEVSWIELVPLTGRTHQLRVHCAKAAHPILGDRTYRGARRVTREDGSVLAVSRTMLHCARVSLAGDIVVESRWHEDFAALWAALA